MNGLKAHSLFEFSDTLLPEELAVLEEYKTAPSGLTYQLNAFLRGRQGGAAPNPLQIQRLDSAIRKSRLVESKTLFRATCAEDFDRFVRDGVFHDPAYASTAMSESLIAGHFVSGFSKQAIKLIVECPAKTNAVYLELVGDNSETEGECLLPRCGRYRVVRESARITETKAIAQAMGQSNWYHAQDFEALRIITLSLLL